MLAGQLAGAADAEAAAAGEGQGGWRCWRQGDPATSLRQLLSWSSRQLSPSAAQMFALLGVHCGPDITIPAAASLAGVPAADTRRAITELADASRYFGRDVSAPTLLLPFPATGLTVNVEQWGQPGNRPFASRVVAGPRRRTHRRCTDADP